VNRSGRMVPGLRGIAALVVLVAAALCTVARAAEQPVAYTVRVDGTITEAFADAVERRLQYAREQGVHTVILELDTPGGTVQDSMDLADYIFQLEDMDVIAYIHPKAYSGGTMVALACKEVYIDAAVGMMGDVAPVTPTGEIVGEKIQTVLREKMGTYARARGYPEALVKAMVTKETEVWRIQSQNEPEGKYTYLTGAQFDAMTDQERAKIVIRTLIVPAGDLLTMDAQRAVEYGFARKAVHGPQELYGILGLDPRRVERLYLSGSERALTVLDMVSPLLIVAGFILLFVELTHPGLWVPGIAGLSCFAAFFLIKYSLHYPPLLAIVLFAVGLVLLLLEIFVIPGFGAAGVVGILLLFVSLVLALQDFYLPESPAQTLTFELNLLTVAGSFAAAFIGIAVLARFVPAMPILGRLVHQRDLSAAHVGDLSEVRTPGLSAMVGQEGVALTPLRPAGRAGFGDKVLDVVTEGDFVEKGARVQIQDIQGSRVVVKPC